MSPPDEIGPDLLDRWALDYLARYASSEENLRRVLLRRARRRAPATAVGPQIEALIARYRDSGLIDDAAYAAARALSLYRHGESTTAIRARLQAKGISAEMAAGAVGGLAEGAVDPDLAAACAFARRRRLGPHRQGPADLARELGAFARAGFSRRIAEMVLGCADAAALDALGKSGRD